MCGFWKKLVGIAEVYQPTCAKAECFEEYGLRQFWERIGRGFLSSKPTVDSDKWILSISV